MSIENDVRDYVINHLPDLHKTKRYYESIDLDVAIEKAALGQTPNKCGMIKMNSHQRRIGYKKCGEGLKILGEQRYKKRIASARDFESLLAVIDEVSKHVHGLEILWSYDSALRIGFNREIYPELVYIQCGVLKGAKRALGINKIVSRAIDLVEFPSAIQTLEPYEAENFLCVWGKEKSRRC